MMKHIGKRSFLFALLAILFSLGAAAQTTVTGEIVETYCWAVHHVGGTGHAQCGIECAKRGLPVALYDSKTQTGYILLPDRDKMSLPSDLVAAMGRRVAIQGEVVTRGRIQFLIVRSWRQQ